jgi:ERF superfamily
MTQDLQEKTPSSKAPKIYEAMRRIMGQMDAIEAKRSPGLSFAFRGIKDFVQAIQPLMVTHGVTMVPTHKFLQVYRDERDKGMTTHIWLEGTFTFYHCLDGSSVTMTAIGEGKDVSDKATNKAMSAALKYALSQGFMALFEDIEDSDEDQTDISPIAAPKERKQRAKKDDDSKPEAPAPIAAPPETLTKTPVVEAPEELDPERVAAVVAGIKALSDRARGNLMSLGAAAHVANEAVMPRLMAEGKIIGSEVKDPRNIAWLENTVRDLAAGKIGGTDALREDEEPL